VSASGSTTVRRRCCSAVSRRAARETRDLATFVDKVEAKRFAEQIVVVNEDDLSRGCRFPYDARRQIVGRAAQIPIRHVQAVVFTAMSC